MSATDRPPEIRARVFLVGCPRSGTTLLQAMLARHSRIQSFPETHFFSIAYPRNPIKRALTWPALNVRRTLVGFVRELGREDLVPLARVRAFEREYHRALIQVLDRLTLDAGREIWLEKTPRHLHFIHEIARRVPRASFVHIVRNGSDVVASLYQAVNEHPRAWGGTRSLDDCIERWNSDLEITRHWQGRPGHEVVRYEDLLRTPAAVARRLCAFLDVPYEPAMEHPEAAYDQVVRSEEAWKARNLQPIRPGSRKFDRLFDADQQAHIRSRLLDPDTVIGPAAERTADS